MSVSSDSCNSALSRAIEKRQWEYATKLTRRYHQEAHMWYERKGLFGPHTSPAVLPLHEASLLNAPFSFMEALVKVYPKALSIPESTSGRLPLHFAVCHKDVDPRVIALLVKRGKTACHVRDAQSFLPIHYALAYGVNDGSILGLLVKELPESTRKGFLTSTLGKLDAHCLSHVSGVSEPEAESVIQTLSDSMVKSSLLSRPHHLGPHRRAVSDATPRRTTATSAAAPMSQTFGV